MRFNNPVTLPLNFVEDTLFMHTFDIWKVRHYNGPNPDANEYELYSKNERGLLTGDDRPADVGDLYQTSTSSGQIGLTENHPVDMGWVLINKSMVTPEIRSAEYGECYLVSGHPNRVMSTPTREIGTTICNIARLTHRPKTIRVETEG